MAYKRKKVEKTLYMSLHICYIGDKKMKEISINGVRYNIVDQEDEISLVHMLVHEGYTIQQVAQILRISERKVIRYLGDCW